MKALVIARAETLKPESGAKPGVYSSPRIPPVLQSSELLMEERTACPKLKGHRDLSI